MTVPEMTSRATMSSAIADANNYVAWILEKFRPSIGRRVLEVGTGYGTYRAHMPILEHYVGIDLDPAAVAAGAARDSTGRYLAADVAAADFGAKVAADRLDTIICANVLEHIEDDRAALINMRNALVPGGHLLLFVPALPGLYSDLDRLAGHHRRYQRAALGRMAQKAGFTISALEYFNPLGGLGWWVNKFKHYDTLDAAPVNWQIRFFDRYAIPVSKLLNPLTKAYFGQSLIGIFQR